jgi:hypothetical protein
MRLPRKRNPAHFARGLVEQNYLPVLVEPDAPEPVVEGGLEPVVCWPGALSEWPGPVVFF